MSALTLYTHQCRRGAERRRSAGTGTAWSLVHADRGEYCAHVRAPAPYITRLKDGATSKIKRDESFDLPRFLAMHNASGNLGRPVLRFLLRAPPLLPCLRASMLRISFAGTLAFRTLRHCHVFLRSGSRDAHLLAQRCDRKFLDFALGWRSPAAVHRFGYRVQ